MEFDRRLDEFKTIFRRSALPDTVRQIYERVFAFVDAGNDTERVVEFSASLAAVLGCELNLYFPVPDPDEDPLPVEELLGEQRYEDVQELLHTYERLEGTVTETILEQVPGEEDETLCILPAPFHLTDDEETNPEVIGEVLSELLASIQHPTVLVRKDPAVPPDLYDRVYVVGSTLQNLMRLLRCTAGLCPAQTTIQVRALADRRFVRSMEDLLKESKEDRTSKTGDRLRTVMVNELKRKLRQYGEKLQKECGISLEYRITEDAPEEALGSGDLIDGSPSLLAVATSYTGGGYDPAVLRPLFRHHHRSEILTV